jgi:hypothetical protein
MCTVTIFGVRELVASVIAVVCLAALPISVAMAVSTRVEVTPSAVTICRLGRSHTFRRGDSAVTESWMPAGLLKASTVLRIADDTHRWGLPMIWFRKPDRLALENAVRRALH